MKLNGVGVWSAALRMGDPDEIRDAAAEIEQLGYTAIWIPGGAGGDIFPASRRLLEATEKIVVATGIVNIWSHEPAEVAAEHAALTREFPGRFLLGLGVSHSALVDREEPGRYRKPLEKMRTYLDELDAQGTPVPKDERCLAALGPKMLELSRERSLGAHPYLVNPDYSRWARGVLGPGPLLACEQPAVIEVNRRKAQELARQHLAIYLTLPNYRNNLLRMGFTERDLEGGGSHGLIEDLIAIGDAEAVREWIRLHHDFGADHVCVQLLTGDRETLPLAQWRQLSEALHLTSPSVARSAGDEHGFDFST